MHDDDRTNPAWMPSSGAAARGRPLPSPPGASAPCRRRRSRLVSQRPAGCCPGAAGSPEGLRTGGARVSEVSADTPPPEPLGSWRVLVQSFGTLAVGEGVARLLGLVAVFWTARRLAAGVFALAALFATHRQADRNLLWLFALVLPARALNLRWMVLGVRASKAVAVGNVASQLVFAGGVFLLVSDKHDTSVVPILQAGGEFAYALVVLA